MHYMIFRVFSLWRKKKKIRKRKEKRVLLNIGEQKKIKEHSPGRAAGILCMVLTGDPAFPAFPWSAGQPPRMGH